MNERMSRVCFVGDTGVGKSFLKSALIDECARNKGVVTKSDTLHLDNKYYHVDLTISEQQHQTFREKVDVQYEGIVLVFDANRLSTVDALHSIVEYVTSVPVKLLVCNSCLDSVPAPGVLAEGQKLATAISVELVHVTHAATFSKHQAHIEEGTQGFDRVLEVLQCHMWPSLTLKSRANPCQARSSSLNRCTYEKEQVHTDNRDVNGVESDTNNWQFIFDEVNRVRKAANSATDEDRRRSAAETTLRLMKMMKLDNDGLLIDEDDDDEDSSNNDERDIER